LSNGHLLIIALFTYYIKKTNRNFYCLDGRLILIFLDVFIGSAYALGQLPQRFPFLNFLQHFFFFSFDSQQQPAAQGSFSRKPGIA